MPADPDVRRTARTIAGSCLLMRTRRLNRLITRIYDEALRPHGISPPQCNILVAVALRGPVQPSALAAALDLEKSTLSRNTARMIDHGWLQTGAAGDARLRPLEITAAGRRLLAAIEPAWRAAQRRVRARLGPDAIAALDGMRASLREP